MEAKNILKSLVNDELLDNDASMAVLKSLHAQGLFNLVDHFKELTKSDLCVPVTRITIDRMIARLSVMRELLPADDDIIVSAEEEKRSSEDILSELERAR